MYGSHSEVEIREAIDRREPVYRLTTGFAPHDAVLIGDEAQIRADVLAHHGLDEWPEHWSLDLVEADERPSAEKLARALQVVLVEIRRQVEAAPEITTAGGKTRRAVPVELAVLYREHGDGTATFLAARYDEDDDWQCF